MFKILNLILALIKLRAVTKSEFAEYQGLLKESEKRQEIAAYLSETKLKVEKLEVVDLPFKDEEVIPELVDTVVFHPRLYNPNEEAK